MASNDNENPSKQNSWVDYTSNLLNVNAKDWGAICGDPAVVIEKQVECPVDPENQESQSNSSSKSTQLQKPVQNRSMGQNVAGANSYLPEAYVDDESDYGEILVNKDAHDAISTVTPATFVQRGSRMTGFSHHVENIVHNSALCSTSCEDLKSKRRRKLLLGGIVVVALMLVAVIVTIPVVISRSRAANKIQVSSLEKGDIENIEVRKDKMSGIDDESFSYGVDKNFGGVLYNTSLNEGVLQEEIENEDATDNNYEPNLDYIIKHAEDRPLGTGNNNETPQTSENLENALPSSQSAPSPVPTYISATPVTELPTIEPTKFTESVVRIALQTDKYGYETSWSLEAIHVDDFKSTNTSTVIDVVNENTYNSYQSESKEFVLPRGSYRFTLKDAFGDGFCCKDFKGYYSISIDGREVIKGGSYRSEITYDFLVGYSPKMTQREQEWLVAHNVRRKKWHEGNGVSYVPLRWSTALAKQAELWANKLTEDCEDIGINNENGIEEGINLAKNQDDETEGMDQLYPPENTLKRWVDYEEGLSSPHNLHLTQALWRASKYVGCADALREDPNGSVCRIQVCRYVRPGNCQTGMYNGKEGDNWLTPMLADTSTCLPECPPEGCF